MRAYGNLTELIIDRDREATSHRMLAERGMAPPLLGRFKNGLLYGYIPGKPCTPEDLTQRPTWRGVAQKLGEWHAKVPISAIVSHTPAQNGTNGVDPCARNGSNGNRHPSSIAARQPKPNVWTVMQNWINTLSTDSQAERERRDTLQTELERSFKELDSTSGIGQHGFVFAHCDLLSGNVIQLPLGPNATDQIDTINPVTFIDYEYATPAPAAFDLANHFAEWAGFDLDYNSIPPKHVRQSFLEDYLSSYCKNASLKFSPALVDELHEQVNMYRGIPGLYWGIWALIQAKISEIDFDYANYAEQRLQEYYDWREQADPARYHEVLSRSLREHRWAQN